MIQSPDSMQHRITLFRCVCPRTWLAFQFTIHRNRAKMEKIPVYQLRSDSYRNERAVVMENRNILCIVCFMLLLGILACFLVVMKLNSEFTEFKEYISNKEIKTPQLSTIDILVENVKRGIMSPYEAVNRYHDSRDSELLTLLGKRAIRKRLIDAGIENVDSQLRPKMIIVE